MLIVDYYIVLFPDTEIRKDIPQEVIRRDLPGDLTKMIKGLSDIDGQKIA